MNNNNNNLNVTRPTFFGPDVNAQAAFANAKNASFGGSPLLMMGQTKQLNTVTNNFKANKRFRKMEEECSLENNIQGTQYGLSQRTLLPLKYGPREEQISSPELTEGLGELAEAFSTVTGWPKIPVTLGILGALNSAMRGRYVIQLNDYWTEPVTLYQMIIAPSGQKKSLLASMLKKPLMQFIADWQAQEQESNIRAALYRKSQIQNNTKNGKQAPSRHC